MTRNTVVGQYFGHLVHTILVDIKSLNIFHLQSFICRYSTTTTTTRFDTHVDSVVMCQYRKCSLQFHYVQTQHSEINNATSRSGYDLWTIPPLKSRENNFVVFWEEKHHSVKKQQGLNESYRFVVITEVSTSLRP